MVIERVRRSPVYLNLGDCWLPFRIEFRAIGGQ